MSVNPDISLSDSDAVCTEACDDFVTKYEAFKQRIRDGELENTANFGSSIWIYCSISINCSGGSRLGIWGFIPSQ